MQNTDRKSNLELLRIISMILIVGYHLYQHSDDGSLMMMPFSLNKFFLILIGSWGIVGVYCFVIMSAWFMLGAKEYKIERGIKIAVQTTFYSLVMYIAIQYITKSPIKSKKIIQSFMSFADDQYWFVQSYLCLLIFVPILNYVIRKMTKKVLDMVVIISFFVVMIWRFVLWSCPISEIGLFIFLYFLTACIKNNDARYIKRWHVILIVSSSLTTFFSVVISAMPDIIRESSLAKYIYISLIGKFSPFMLIVAISLFFFVLKHEIYSKKINEIGKHTFAVYLIHENIYVYPILWKCISVKDYIGQAWFGIYLLLVVIMIFTGCMIIDVLLYKIYSCISMLLCNFGRPILYNYNHLMGIFKEENEKV